MKLATRRRHLCGGSANSMLLCALQELLPLPRRGPTAAQSGGAPPPLGGPLRRGELGVYMAGGGSRDKLEIPSPPRTTKV
jgi:hypothetical protein